MSSPNPPVGAVLINDRTIVGKGWTQAPGQAHAEMVAINQAGPKAKGSTLYVTLEPCCYLGRTPPCTNAIIEAGISEIHVALLDPNPLVNGNGISELKRAGIKVHISEQKQEAFELIEAHAKFITSGLPFVTVKFAMSLDGKIASKTGDSKWVTGPQARQYVQQLRAASNAILVGINTVLSDDPRLTVRNHHGSPNKRQPLRIVVDSQGRTPSAARLLKEPGNILIATTEGAHKQKIKSPELETVCFPAKESRVDLEILMRHLGQRNISSVLVEGGGTITGSLFDLGLVDKIVAFVAPIIIGGKEAITPVTGAGVDKVSQALRLHRTRIEHFGEDIAIIGYCKG